MLLGFVWLVSWFVLPLQMFTSIEQSKDFPSPRRPNFISLKKLTRVTVKSYETSSKNIYKYLSGTTYLHFPVIHKESHLPPNPFTYRENNREEKVVTSLYKPQSNQWLHNLLLSMSAVSLSAKK